MTCKYDNRSTESIFTRKRLKWLPHFLQILYVGSFVLTGRNTYIGYVDDIVSLIVFLIFMGLTYLTTNVFMPKYLFKKKYLLYFGVVFVSVIMTAIMLRYLQLFCAPYLYDKKETANTFVMMVFTNILLYIVLAGPFSFWRILLKWTEDNNRIHDLENATIQSELQQLKNQINPHFLFNMLNNANVLIRKDPDKASETLLGLSELLRYQLYESSRQNVLLGGDIKAVKELLNLEKIRRDHFDFTIDVIGDPNTVFIPPLLFIPFVENATKHNLDPEKTSYIHIVFDIQEDSLCFSCVNSKPRVSSQKSADSGLGLSNSYRRLKLLYDDQYQLDINDEKDIFTVNLKIPI